jgi:hypothetical protein
MLQLIHRLHLLSSHSPNGKNLSSAGGILCLPQSFKSLLTILEVLPLHGTINIGTLKIISLSRKFLDDQLLHTLESRKCPIPKAHWRKHRSGLLSGDIR